MARLRSCGGLKGRSVLNKPFRAILQAAKINKRLTSSSGPRRTAARLYRKVADSAVASAVAGHLTDKMHRHYGRVDAEEKQAAANRLRERLELAPAPRLKSGTASGTEPQNRGLLLKLFVRDFDPGRVRSGKISRPGMRQSVTR